VIYHITEATTWLAQQQSSDFTVSSLTEEGFIHCSTAAQVGGVLQRYYSDQKNLLMLHIDESKVTADLKFEASTEGEYFPHIYGPINKEAILRIEQLPDQR
jgi:uncharacterized protein (DUF952 family)